LRPDSFDARSRAYAPGCRSFQRKDVAGVVSDGASNLAAIYDMVGDAAPQVKAGEEKVKKKFEENATDMAELSRLHILHSGPSDTLAQKQKAVLIAQNGLFYFNPGDDLRSHTVTHAVSSARRGLTSVFGMGTGVTLAV
jgi:hypothetical protein